MECDFEVIDNDGHDDDTMLVASVVETGFGEIVGVSELGELLMLVNGPPIASLYGPIEPF